MADKGNIECDCGHEHAGDDKHGHHHQDDDHGDCHHDHHEEDEEDYEAYNVVNQYLVRLKDSVMGDLPGKRVFVPCCGNMVTMKWLLDQSYTVVGVELEDKWVKHFFNKHEIEFSEHERLDVKGKLYEGLNGKLKLYACDIANFTKDTEGAFDFILDVYGLHVLPKSYRQGYVDLVKGVMVNPKAKFFIETWEHDEIIFPGPPFALTEAQLKELFGAGYKVECLVKEDFRYRDLSDAEGITWPEGECLSTVYVVTHK